MSRVSDVWGDAMMVLTDYPFNFFSDKEQFLSQNAGVLSELEHKRIVGIYGVWDALSHEWFDDAPMLIVYEGGTLAIQVSSGCSLAVAANAFTAAEKPQWFSTETIRNMHKEHFMWEEDLIWRQYDKLSQFSGAKILSVEPIAKDQELTGLLFRTNAANFVIEDHGDVIGGNVVLPL